MILFSEHTQIIFTHPIKVCPSVCSVHSFQYPFMSGVPQSTTSLDISLEVSATLSQRTCVSSLPSGVLKPGTHLKFDKLGGLSIGIQSVRLEVRYRDTQCFPAIAACSPRPGDHNHAVWSRTPDKQI